MNGPYAIVAKHVTGCSIFSTVQGFWLDYGSHTLMLLCALVTHHLSPSGKASLFQGPLTSACNQLDNKLSVGLVPQAFHFRFCLPALESKIYPPKPETERLNVCHVVHILLFDTGSTRRSGSNWRPRPRRSAGEPCHIHTRWFFSHSSAQSFHAVVAVFSTSCCMHVEQGATLTLTLLDLGPSWT